jgi:malonyl CoA-acyl carrier protein transacylase
VRLRGQLMQEAAPEGVGAMAAVLGADEALVWKSANRLAQVVVPANYNSPGQIVIGGDVRRLIARWRCWPNAACARRSSWPSACPRTRR